MPVTPEQLAAEALAAHRAGAKAVHMHPKTADGVDSLQPDIVGAAVEAVRHAAPGLPLGVTTGFWALPDPDERLRAVEAWTVLPDFASVNWHEPGSEPLARLLLSKGLGVEVGIFHAEAAASWAESDIAAHCMRVMVELGPDGDVATADDVLGEVLAAGSPAPVLLHGLRRKLLAPSGTRRGARCAGTHRPGGHAAAARRLDGPGQCGAGVGGGAAAQSVGAASEKSA